MDNLIRELRQLTLQVIHEIDSLTYEQITAFVERRGQIISQMQNLSTDDLSIYKKDIEPILQYDPVILSRINALRDEASSALTNFTHARTTKKSYDQVYTPDSIFFDKKK